METSVKIKNRGESSVYPFLASYKGCIGLMRANGGDNNFIVLDPGSTKCEPFTLFSSIHPKDVQRLDKGSRFIFTQR